jgi:hypothetical protein
MLQFADGNGRQFGTLYPVRIFSDDPDQDERHVADYRATLSYLLTSYYDHLVEWSNQYLGLKFSGQVGYNFPVDMVNSPRFLLQSTSS